MMIILIDNYDSFTYNLYHYLIEVGAEVIVYRNDAITVAEIMQQISTIEGIVLSPGPCSPDESGICLEIIAELKAVKPILGVCLGHQAIGQVCGGHIVRGEYPMHAKVSQINHLESPLFREIPSSFKATRYHSLIIERASLPNCLKIIAESDDAVIQGVSHVEYPLFGVQFHPESIASEYGHQLLRNFLTICYQYENQHRT